MQSYSNLTAARALIKASLQGIMKSPSAIVFGLAFPLIFILVFGFLGGGGPRSVSVAVAPGTDTASALFQSLKKVPVLKWQYYASPEELRKAMSEGDVAAELLIRDTDRKAIPQYHITITGASTQPSEVAQLKSIINNVIQFQDPEIIQRTNNVAVIEEKQEIVREYKAIDFFLPGQLGFSLMAGSIFGTAFVFFNLRQTLVLKRFFATPVRRSVIVISEAIARMIFQLLTAVVIIGIGHYAFGFTLIHGFSTALQLLLLSALGIMVFMGFGFIVSSVAKSESTIPPMSNLITMPQFLLAGTFFPVSAFPKWLQPISKALPLTYLNDAMRKVAFYGAGLDAIKWDLLALGIWGVVLYVVAGKVFKWE